MMNKKRKLIIAAILIFSATGLFAATYFDAINPLKYSFGSVGNKLGFLSQYRKSLEESRNSAQIDEEMLREIESGLINDEIQTCFAAKIEKQTQELDPEILTYCEQHSKEVERLVQMLNSVPVSEVLCEISSPYIMDGCQGELCNIRVDPVVIKQTILLSDIIDGEEVKTLQPNEKLKRIIDFKILVKKIGKARALYSVTADMLENGINRGSTFSVLSYAGEGWAVGCSGKNNFGFEENQQIKLSPYESENWVYVETEDGKLGYIPYDALQTNERG